MAMPTSLAPLIAAVTGSSFSSSRCRIIFSNTTIELSTSIPTASASPAIETRFKLISKRAITGNVSIIESGMESPTAPALFAERRKNNKTSTAMIIACIPVFLRLLTEPFMKVD